MKQTVRKLSSMPFPFGAPTWPTSVAREPKVRRIGLDYDNEWSRKYPARLARAIVVDFITGPLTRRLAPPTIVGAERLDLLEGPVIFVANHASHADTAVLLSNLPARFRHKTVVAAAADFFFDKTWKAMTFSFLLAAIPIERTKVNRRSSDQAAALLEEGWSLVIFPEGGRTPDGWMHEFKPGAAYMAAKTGTTIVPIYLEGTRDVLPKGPGFDGMAPGGSGTESKGSSKLRRRAISITFGDPLRPGPDADARRFAAEVEAAVGLLGREVATDFWQARRNPDATTTHGPDASSWRRTWALRPPRPIKGDTWPEA